jgi:hypothetical protein
MCKRFTDKKILCIYTLNSILCKKEKSISLTLNLNFSDDLANILIKNNRNNTGKIKYIADINAYKNILYDNFLYNLLKKMLQNSISKMKNTKN